MKTSLYKSIKNRYMTFRKSGSMIEPVFIAPTEAIELAIINYCVEELELPFGEFWYKWFDHNKENNHGIHIECNVVGLRNRIMNTLKKLDTVELVKFFEVREVPLPDYCEYKYQYFIHFKRAAYDTQEV